MLRAAAAALGCTVRGAEGAEQLGSGAALGWSFLAVTAWGAQAGRASCRVMLPVCGAALQHIAPIVWNEPGGRAPCHLVMARHARVGHQWVSLVA